MIRLLLILTLTGLFLTGLLFSARPAASPAPAFEIKFENYVLDNGLKVVLHEDHSNPIVAVATLVHAGSNREKPGRTGFAHFFEHMSFNHSENVPRGANRKLIPEWGGERNGGTSNDMTVFYEVVPKDAFEKILWIDSDRLGFMINTVTEAALEREKQVVKNEKRQNYDNVPYGYSDEILSASLYPPDHPYHWTVIGSLPDLQAATLADVKEFYGHFYSPGNATLVIAGDIDIPATKRLVERWFGEIKRGPEVRPLPPRPSGLTASKSLYYEDGYAQLPQLEMIFPTVPAFHPDSYALEVLARLLAGSKQSPLYKVIVEEQKLAPRVTVYHDSKELAGEFTFSVRANAGTALERVDAALQEGLTRFEQKGFTDNELNRIKALQETRFYNSISTVLNKAFQLANYNEFAGNPGFAGQDFANSQRVTREDVMRVFRQYLKDKPRVLLSTVPRGKPELAVQGAGKAAVWTETVTAGKAEEQVSQGAEAVFEKTKTKYGRFEPPFGPLPLVKPPAGWNEKLVNGMRVYGIELQNLPLAVIDLTIQGGHWLDQLEKSGTASLLADLLLQGTRNRTPAELEEAIGLLGSTINISAGSEEIRITASTLSRNFEKTAGLIQEILLEPRWDENEYARLKRTLENRLKDREADPNYIAATAFNRIVYGEGHILGRLPSGTPETVARITLDDLKEFYHKYFSPAVTAVHVVGQVEKARVLKTLAGLAGNWKPKEVAMPGYPPPPGGFGGKVYFIDVPGAKSSVIRAGKLVPSTLDPDFNNLKYAGEILGGGPSGRLFQLLRIEKGYTYGAYGFFSESLAPANFTISTIVRTNVTAETLQLIRDLVRDYQSTFTAREMEITKNKLVKESTRAYESLAAKLGILQEMSKFNRPPGFTGIDQQELLAMKLDDFHRMIGTHLDEKALFYLVVGDGATCLSRIPELGKGPAILLDVYGREKQPESPDGRQSPAARAAGLR